MLPMRRGRTKSSSVHRAMEGVCGGWWTWASFFPPSFLFFSRYNVTVELVRATPVQLGLTAIGEQKQSRSDGCPGCPAACNPPFVIYFYDPLCPSGVGTLNMWIIWGQKTRNRVKVTWANFVLLKNTSPKNIEKTFFFSWCIF